MREAELILGLFFFTYGGVLYVIEIDLGTMEYYDEDKNEFVYEDGGVVRFEYSLKSVYDWEARWKRPFLKNDHTPEEIKDFYLTMAIDPIDPKFMNRRVMETLSSYVGSTPTATTFTSRQNNQNGNSLGIGKVYTAEEIYGLMFLNHIPLEFETRNLNRLLVILRVITSYNQPKEKMDQSDIYEQNRKLNEERKAKYGTKG